LRILNALERGFHYLPLSGFTISSTNRAERMVKAQRSSQTEIASGIEKFDLESQNGGDSERSLNIDRLR